LDSTSSASRVLDFTRTALELNHGTLRGIGTRLNMLKTLVKSISSQTVNSCKELKAFQPLLRDIYFPGIFSANAGLIPIYIRKFV
jgi:hypothetical protein